MNFDLENINTVRREGFKNPEQERLEQARFEAYNIVLEALNSLPIEADSRFVSDARAGLWQAFQHTSVAEIDAAGDFSLRDGSVRLHPRYLQPSIDANVAVGILKHEYIHALGVHDESLTQWLEENMDGGSALKTGYDELVKELGEFAENLSVGDILVEFTADPEETMANLIYKLFYAGRPAALAAFGTQEDVAQILASKIEQIGRLFPRLYEKMQTGKDSAAMEADVDLEFLVNRIGNRILERVMVEVQTEYALEG